jgi:hypothetical protein|tara:strand:- start:374 stop:550 length:177 start_codon:yes stop_codon:yes gene_type:complete
MGILKQLMIDKQDELGEDWEGSSEELIELMVEEYMRSEEYHKEHIDQEKKIANNIDGS